MNSISVNGKTIKTNGNNISIINGKVIVDGKTIINLETYENHIVIEGDCNNIKADGSVEIRGSCKKSIDCGGSVIIGGNVEGNVDCGGSCHCGDVQGDIDAGGSVRCARAK